MGHITRAHMYSMVLKIVKIQQQQQQQQQQQTQSI